VLQTRYILPGYFNEQTAASSRRPKVSPLSRKIYRGISRHIAAYRGISRHIAAYRGISRHIAAYRGISSVSPL
jgi:hypothetical protein